MDENPADRSGSDGTPRSKPHTPKPPTPAPGGPGGYHANPDAPVQVPNGEDTCCGCYMCTGVVLVSLLVLLGCYAIACWLLGQLVSLLPPIVLPGWRLC